MLFDRSSFLNRHAGHIPGFSETCQLSVPEPVSVDVLASIDVVDEDDYDCVCNMIREIVPDHLHLPKADELQRMAVLSFRKPVRL